MNSSVRWPWRDPRSALPPVSESFQLHDSIQFLPCYHCPLVITGSRSVILRLPELLFVVLVEHALVFLEDDFVLELVELILELIRTDLYSIASIGTVAGLLNFFFDPFNFARS